jgi:RNA polymerase sigma-70 factor (ECF subfamily)
MLRTGVVDQTCLGLDLVQESRRSDEADLLERVQGGDRSAFETLVVRYQSSIYGLLCRLIEDPEEARDLAQETFLKAYQHVGEFRGEANLKTWLYRIAINQASNHHRWWIRRRRNRIVSMDEGADGDVGPWAERIVDEQPDPEQALMAHERVQQVARALTKVKEPYRTAVVLRDIEEMAYEEIAEVWRVSIGTVKSRIARGRELLRQELMQTDRTVVVSCSSSDD